MVENSFPLGDLKRMDDTAGSLELVTNASEWLTWALKWPMIPLRLTVQSTAPPSQYRTTDYISLG